MALSIEIEVPQAVILTKERKNKKEEKMIRLEPRLSGDVLLLQTSFSDLGDHIF